MRGAALLALGGALLGLACTRPAGPPPGAGWGRAGPEAAAVRPDAAGRVRVLFPIGTCATGWLEVQEFERSTGTWLPHAQGDLLRAGTCRLEDPARLLNEIRVRCVDPSGARAPSPWVVGVDLDASAAPDARCPAPPEAD